MKLIGCLIWWAFGTICILISKKVYKKQQRDYKQYPIVDATVIGTHDYHGKRWMVEFKDKKGREVVGADDTFAESTFHPQKYAIPIRGDVEQVYCWENIHPSNHSISGMKILYTFHFCNEDYYVLRKKREKRNRKIFWLVAILMYIFGAMILISG